LEAGGVSLTLQAADGLATISSNRDLLVQALDNLLDTARNTPGNGLGFSLTLRFKVPNKASGKIPE
jgi:hypothetical protein